MHALIDFTTSAKKINTVIGDGKRFIAYEVIERLQKTGKKEILTQLEEAVAVKGKEKGKLHEVWKESFDWKYCETAKFACQKPVYMHNNPCTGKWNLAADIAKYEHSSAGYYLSGKHAAYEVVDVEEIFGQRAMETGNLDNL